MLVSIQAGNSDNKLSQQEWHAFVMHLDGLIEGYESARHFFGGSVTWAKWQNVCWVVEVPVNHFDGLTRDITQIRALYDQDAVCVLAGEPMFV